jgi:6-pyruvoyltetrahydropterin/6-carboxytetrahydropterin synthase
MYETGLAMKMISSHYLPGGSAEERKEHHHNYTVEVIVRGSGLNPQGYLVDITSLRSILGSVLGRYHGCCMNELPEFTIIPPSLENLAREIWVQVRTRLKMVDGWTLVIKIWEAEDAWASHEGVL